MIHSLKSKIRFRYHVKHKLTETCQLPNVLNLKKGDEYDEGLENPGDQEGKCVLHRLSLLLN